MERSWFVSATLKSAGFFFLKYKVVEECINLVENFAFVVSMLAVGGFCLDIIDQSSLDVVARVVFFRCRRRSCVELIKDDYCIS